MSQAVNSALMLVVQSSRQNDYFSFNISYERFLMITFVKLLWNVNKCACSCFGLFHLLERYFTSWFLRLVFQFLYRVYADHYSTISSSLTLISSHYSSSPHVLIIHIVQRSPISFTWSVPLSLISRIPFMILPELSGIFPTKVLILIFFHHL